MKIYTEEQVRKALTTKNNILPVDLFLEQMTPIELPSDEEIDDKANKRSWTISDKIMFENGAKWVIEQIKQQDGRE